MSRIGKRPITLPQGVTIKVEGNHVTVTGPKGTLENTFLDAVEIEVKENLVNVNLKDENAGNIHGLTRSLLHNMVVGVSEGFEKKLEIAGVGYKAVKQGTKIVLSLGFSHTVEFNETETIKFELPDANTIIVKGIDKQEVGQIAAEIRDTKRPEPYKGKGIKYAGERILRKEGKTGGKK